MDGEISVSRSMLFGAGIVWALAIAAGLVVLWDYDAGPAPAGHPPTRWPRASRVPAPTSQPHLIVAAHPKCPCTRASIGELERLMTRARGLVDAYVLFYRPDNAADSWERSDLWTRAAAIPGVHVLRDDRGDEAARFGALASGQTMLYAVNGDLLFSGGITASRGHAGDNTGASAILALIEGSRTHPTVTPVYGCIIRDLSGLRPVAGGAVAFLRNVMAGISVPVGAAR